jgi:hypothetical protein
MPEDIFCDCRGSDHTDCGDRDDDDGEVFHIFIVTFKN